MSDSCVTKTRLGAYITVSISAQGGTPGYVDVIVMVYIINTANLCIQKCQIW